MKKVAVFLRGNRRVWNYTKENIFKFCDDLAEQVDYYVAMWCVQKSRHIVGSMGDDFKDRNLKTFKLLDNHWDYNAWEGPAYLSSILNKEKINEELFSGVQYDAVLDTRPDVVFKQLTKIEKPKPWTVGTTRLDLEKVGGWQGMEDHVFFSDSPTSSLFCNRLSYGNQPGVDGHLKLLKYCNMSNLTPCQVTGFESKIVRPTIADQFFSVPPNVDMNVPQVAMNAWERMSLSSRIEVLENTCIGIDEYMTALNLTY